MNPYRENAPPGADDLLDDLDAALLDGVANVFTAADPIPGDLIERIRFAVALEEIDAEVSRLREETELVTATARGADEESRTITFDSTSLTIMITISTGAGDTVRLDGWLAPPAAHRVELRTSGGRLQTNADDHGRFVLEEVPRGLAQIMVRTSGDGSADNSRCVVTPSIVV